MRRLTQLYFNFGSRIDRDLNARIHGVARELLARRLPGVTDVIVGYTSLHLEYDPALVGAAHLRKLVHEGMAASPGTHPARRVVEVATVYDGPDLQELARAVGLPASEVVRRHASVDYLAYAVGFTPGFAFLGDVDPALRRPRLGEPRAHVPAGAVGVADAQTGVYPLPSPGGWNLIGRALEAVYDPHRAEPNLIEPGDTVRFVPAEGGAELPPLPPLELLPEEPRHPAFRVHEPGLLDLVVDEGRFLVGRLGLARSGPLDAASARLANALLGNPPASPLLEFNLLGPTLEALRDVVVAFTGAGVTFLVDGRPAAPNTTTLIRRGQLLSFPSAAVGSRGYLGVAGGIESRAFHGSAAVDVRGLIGRPLRSGDALGMARPRTPRQGRSFTPHSRPTETLTLRLLRGPQYDGETVAALAAKPLRIERSDRMGVRLGASEALGDDVISEGVPLGAVQLTPDGRPLILLNDRGTMGGYVKPAILDPRDLPRLAQAREGAWVRFVMGSG